MTTETESGGQTSSVAVASQPEGYITKKEVARRVKKTVRTVEHWQRRGILPFVKCGQSVLFKWDDVERHLNEHFRVCRRTVVKTGVEPGPLVKAASR